MSASAIITGGLLFPPWALLTGGFTPGPPLNPVLADLEASVVLARSLSRAARINDSIEARAEINTAIGRNVRLTT